MRISGTLRVSAACAFSIIVAACAAPGTSPSLTRATSIPSPERTAGITIGRSTKADVVSLLGKTTSISFDSGVEVWVYHLARDTPGRAEQEKAEFVVLFSPQGIVTKTRIRPPTKPG